MPALQYQDKHLQYPFSENIREKLVAILDQINNYESIGVQLMSETETKPTETATRTIETIQTEYSQACAVLGDRHFKASLLNNEIQSTYAQISRLNSEALALKTTEKTNETA